MGFCGLRKQSQNNFFAISKLLGEQAYFCFQAFHNFSVSSLGISQLQKVNKIIKIRREKAKYFTSILLKTNTSEIIIPNFPNNLFHVYQEYHIKINSGKNKRDELKKYLWKKGIGTRISFLPIHKTHFYKNILGYNNILKNTEYISEQTLTLPLYPDLKKTEMDYIAKEIKNFFS